MKDNVNRISFDEGTILGGKVDGADVEGYFPLADVPDTVWKSSRPHEKPNHYADMDQEGNGAFAGQDLFEISKNPKNLKPKTWLDYYKSIGVTPSKQGSLPFRVWQIYDAMVAYVSSRHVLHFSRPRAFWHITSATPANPCTARSSPTATLPCRSRRASTPPTRRAWCDPSGSTCSNRSTRS